MYEVLVTVGVFAGFALAVWLIQKNRKKGTGEGGSIRDDKNDNQQER